MDALPRVGFQVWGQFTTWPELAATARDIERLGFDSLWANDHLFPAAGAAAASPEGIAGPFLEGWMTAAGFALVTSRIPVGVLVSGAGYRNAGLLVKQATALDHLSGGRALLGLGAGWHQRDHSAFGFDLPPVRERLDRLDEQSAAVRALLDAAGPVTTDGTWVRMDRAVNDPPPVGRLPLMIGGRGRSGRCASSPATPTRGTGRGPPRSGRAAPRSWTGIARRSAVTRPRSAARRAYRCSTSVRRARRRSAPSRRSWSENRIPAAEAAAIADADRSPAPWTTSSPRCGHGRRPARTS